MMVETAVACRASRLWGPSGDHHDSESCESNEAVAWDPTPSTSTTINTLNQHKHLAMESTVN